MTADTDSGAAKKMDISENLNSGGFLIAFIVLPHCGLFTFNISWYSYGGNPGLCTKNLSTETIIKE